MKSLPKKYSWLAKEGAPKMLVEMLKIYGTLEAPGSADNPTILGWAKEVGLQKVYTHDSIAWCGLTMAVVAKRASKPVVDDPLWALNWKEFGIATTRPMLGDVMVKPRFNEAGKVIGGHVTQYVCEDATHYHCMGGNQSDQINIVRYSKKDKWSFRRPLWTFRQPSQVRVILVSEEGALTGGSMT